MSLTPPCDTPGCRRMSVSVYVTCRILGLIKKARRLCPGCAGHEPDPVGISLGDHLDVKRQIREG